MAYWICQYYNCPENRLIGGSQRKSHNTPLALTGKSCSHQNIHFLLWLLCTKFKRKIWICLVNRKENQIFFKLNALNHKMLQETPINISKTQVKGKKMGTSQDIYTIYFFF